MKAVQAKSFGGPEVLEVAEVPDPVAGPGEAVVEVSVADVLALDAALRGGAGREYFGIEPPFVPGTAVGGEIVSVGEGVGDGWIGRRIVALTGISGGYAERAVVPEKELIPVPDALGLDKATALINDGRTALALVEGVGVRPGEWALVMPAGSGLGLLLVQLARKAGARVIATARGQKKLGLARDAGAEVTVDYTTAGWTERLREATAGGGVNVVFDGVGGDIGRAALEATTGGGRFAGFGDSSGSYAGYDGAEPRGRGVTVLGPELVHIGGTEKARRLAKRALAEAAAGKLSPHVGRTFAMEEAAEAHEALESRKTTGKTLLVIRPSSPFARSELRYMGSRTLGRLATAQPNGTLQNNPVGFRYNPETATIDIRGHEMAKSRKYRNVAANGRAALVVDDVPSTSPWRVRCLEIRGRAEAVATSGGEVIRIHPERIINFGIDEPGKDPHEVTGNTRDANQPPERSARDREEKTS